MLSKNKVARMHTSTLTDQSACTHICRHVTTPQLLDGFSKKLIIGSPLKMLLQIVMFLNIGQQ
jgi:hypothetical protein